MTAPDVMIKLSLGNRPFVLMILLFKSSLKSNIFNIFTDCCLYCDNNSYPSMVTEDNHYRDWVIEILFAGCGLLSVVFFYFAEVKRSDNHRNNLLCTSAKWSLVYWYFYGILTFSIHLLLIHVKYVDTDKPNMTISTQY